MTPLRLAALSLVVACSSVRGPPSPSEKLPNLPTRWELSWVEPASPQEETSISAVTADGVVIGNTSWDDSGLKRSAPFFIPPGGVKKVALKTVDGAIRTVALGGHAPEGFAGFAQFSDGRTIPVFWAWDGGDPEVLPLPAGATGVARATGSCGWCAVPGLIVGSVEAHGGDPIGHGEPWVWSIPPGRGAPVGTLRQEGRATVVWGVPVLSDVIEDDRALIAGMQRGEPGLPPHTLLQWGSQLRDRPSAITRSEKPFPGTTFWEVAPGCSASAVEAGDDHVHVGWAERADEATGCRKGTRRAMELRRRPYLDRQGLERQEDVPLPLPEPEGATESEALGVALITGAPAESQPVGPLRWNQQRSSPESFVLVAGRTETSAGVSRAQLWVRLEAGDRQGFDQTFELVDLSRSVRPSLAEGQSLLRAMGVSRAGLVAGDGETAAGRRAFLLTPVRYQRQEPLLALQPRDGAGVAPGLQLRPTTFDVSALQVDGATAVAVPRAVDGEGSVVGYIESSEGLESRRAFIASTDGRTRLLPLPDGWGPFSEANDIGLSGEIVGTVRLPSGRRVAARWGAASTPAEDLFRAYRYKGIMDGSIGTGRFGWPSQFSAFAESRAVSFSRKQGATFVRGEHNEDPAEFAQRTYPFCAPALDANLARVHGPDRDRCPERQAPWSLRWRPAQVQSQEVLGWSSEDSEPQLAVGAVWLEGGNQRATLWLDPFVGGGFDLNGLVSAPEGAPWVLERAMAVSSSGVIAGIGRLNGTRTGFVLRPRSRLVRHVTEPRPGEPLPIDTRTLFLVPGH